MKRLSIITTALLLLAGCGSKSDSVKDRLSEYATIQLGSSFFAGISDNGLEVLNYFKLASDEVDNIYWKQMFGDKSLMMNLPDKNQRVYAMVNYGPWDRNSGQSFVSGWGERPLGAAFYPEDMTAEEFEAFGDPDKNSPYTLIRRDSTGALETVWYHEAFAPEIAEINNYLRTAANYTIKASVRDYLHSRIKALETDDYYASDLVWLSMQDSKMDLIIGPEETEDDRLYGTKASYESYVLLKDLNLTSSIAGYAEMIPSLQHDIPCPEEYRQFTPGLNSTVYAYDMVYCAGNANAGIKKIAINLPYDVRVQQEQGTRTAILNNIINAKYNKIILPAGRLLLGRDLTRYLDNGAFFWNIVFREISHGIGVRETVNGRGPVSEALGQSALTIEEVKGDALGLYLNLKFIADGNMDPLVSREDAITTFIVSTIRSARMGQATALGKSNVMLYNILKNSGSIYVDNNGYYGIDFAVAEASVKDLIAKILTIQATGDRDAAEAMIRDLGEAPESLRKDFADLKRSLIPLDLRFQFSW